MPSAKGPGFSHHGAPSQVSLSLIQARWLQHIGPSHTLSAPSPGTNLTVCPMKTLKDVAGEKDMCILLILVLLWARTWTSNTTPSRGDVFTSSRTMKLRLAGYTVENINRHCSESCFCCNFLLKCHIDAAYGETAWNCAPHLSVTEIKLYKL